MPPRRQVTEGRTAAPPHSRNSQLSDSTLQPHSIPPFQVPASSTNRASSFSLGINESPELELCESPKDVSGTLTPYLDVDDTSVDETPAIIKLIRYGTSSNSDSQLNRAKILINVHGLRTVSQVSSFSSSSSIIYSG